MIDDAFDRFAREALFPWGEAASLSFAAIFVSSPLRRATTAYVLERSEVRESALASQCRKLLSTPHGRHQRGIPYSLTLGESVR